jgi:hypothetical protein
MKIVALFACLLLSTLPVGAQDTAHADFTGRWRMQKDKSDFAKFKMPEIVVRVIEQRGVTMNVHTVQTTGERTSTVDAVYQIDGTVSKNVINGRDATSRTFWDGKALVVNTDMKTSKNEDEQIQDRYELSDDGQTLTMTSHVVTEKGDVTMTMVCSKEAVSH